MNFTSLKAATMMSCVSIMCSSMATSAVAEDNSMINQPWQCPTTSNTYFCDDFSSQNTEHWDLLPQTVNSFTPDGAFDIVNDGTNTVLRYTAQKKGGILAVVKGESLKNVKSADYYVEAKIRPRMNDTAASKQLYLLGRYQDGNNWYAGALNIQNSLGSTQVEFAKMVDGELKRIKKIKTQIAQGAKGQLDGQWYSLRLSMKGNNVKVFFDGDEIINLTDDTFSSQGLIGLWTNNKSFEIDDIRVGHADDMPASLTLSPSLMEYIAEVGAEPKVINVTALTDSADEDSFTVFASEPGVVTTELKGNKLSLIPTAEGETVITVTSGSGLSKSITATISPTFVMPTATYDFTHQLTPAANELSVYEDSHIFLTFDSDVSIGKGSVRIFSLENNQQVDKIRLVQESDNIGYGSNVRTINTDPVRVNGRTVSITPHANVLQPGKQYYVVVTKEAFTGATLAGQPFEGIGRNSGWMFTTRTAMPDPAKTELLVDDNGKEADYRTVQGALNHAMANHSVDTPVTIRIKNGIYEEPLYLFRKNNVTLQGESRDGTIIRYKNNESMNSGTSGRPVFLVKDADNLYLDNLTLKNTSIKGHGDGQSETIYFNSVDGRLVVTNSVFISEQDTLNLKGWNWFYNSRIEGNIDFIWGYSKASLFENSEIRTLGDSRGNGSGGYVLQARNQSESDKGFVFLNSRLTRGNGPLGHPVTDATTYLARSGGCSGCYDNIVFVNTQMGNHIKPVGYLDTPVSIPEVATANAGWREYNTMDLNGNPRDLTDRLDTMFYQMSFEEVESGYCSRAQVFSQYDNGNGWNPMPEIASTCKQN